MELDPVIVAVVVVALSIILYLLCGKKSAKGDTVLLLGEMNSGKSAIFFQLGQGEFRETVTSMASNQGKFVPAALADVQKGDGYLYVDFPGHGSRRSTLSKHFPSARGIVLLVDATDPSKAQKTAQYLYTLMSEPSLGKRRVPLLLTFNKTDLADRLMDIPAFKEKVLGYIEQTRHLQSDISDIGSEEHTSENVKVGREGVPFKFAHSPFPIEFARISAKEGDLLAVTDFLKRI